MRRVAVVGGGVTGLAAAWEARRLGAEVVVLEAGDAWGGKVRTVDFAGQRVDVGADAFLVRRPEGRVLAQELGLGDALVHPATSGVWLWARGALRPMPEGTVFGAPSDLRSLAQSGVLAPRDVARAALEPLASRRRGLPAVGTGAPSADELSVDAALAPAFGQAVVDDLVEPLLGGIYAGSTATLGIWSAAPALALPLSRAAKHGSVLAALAAQRAAAPPLQENPVFATLARGLGGLVDALVAQLATAEDGFPAAELRLGARVTAVGPARGGWQVGVVSTDPTDLDSEVLDVDAVILTTPAGATAALLADVTPTASRALADVTHASVATISLAYRPEDVRDVPVGSGLLVPRRNGLLVKAATWGWQKWAHQAGDRCLVRASVGRVDDHRALRLDDESLAERADGELRAMTGIHGAATDRLVTRWPASLPQYVPGHRQRVATVHAAVAALPGLAVAGAALDGVGVAPCIAQGRAAARRVLT